MLNTVQSINVKRTFGAHFAQVGFSDKWDKKSVILESHLTKVHFFVHAVKPQTIQPHPRTPTHSLRAFSSHMSISSAKMTPRGDKDKK